MVGEKFGTKEEIDPIRDHRRKQPGSCRRGRDSRRRNQRAERE